MAGDLDLSQITLDAQMTGKYFWAKLGFLPDRGSWEFRLRDRIKAKLASLGGHVGDRRRSQIMRILDSPAPETIRVIANLRDRVPSTTLKTSDGRQKQIPLGMALLAEADVPWYGNDGIQGPLCGPSAYLGPWTFKFLLPIQYPTCRPVLRAPRKL
jgi:hypothetical protein